MSVLFSILTVTKSKKFVSYKFLSILFKSLSSKSSLIVTPANISIVSDGIRLFPSTLILSIISDLSIELSENDKKTRNIPIL